MKRKKRSFPLNIRRILAFVIDFLLLNMIIVAPYQGIVAKLIPDLKYGTFTYLSQNEEFLRAMSPIIFLMILIQEIGSSTHRDHYA